MIYQPEFVLPFEQAPMIFADGAVIDAVGNLVFLSFWGRDTATQEFLANVELGAQGGLTSLAFPQHLQQQHPSDIGSLVLAKDRLARQLGRTTKNGLFGELCHGFLYDTRVQRPDMATRQGFVILGDSDPHDQTLAGDAVWDLIQVLAPVPLLAHWKGKVLLAVRQHNWVNRLRTMGALRAWHVDLGDPEFALTISEMVKTCELMEYPTDPSR